MNNTFIYIAGHAGFSGQLKPADIPDNPFTVSNLWSTPEYRKLDIQKYGEHVKLGIELAVQQSACMLIMGGGFNRADYIGPAYSWSEAESYLIAAEKSGWLKILSTIEVQAVSPAGKEVTTRIRTVVVPSGQQLTVVLNDYARDSLEDILGGLVIYQLLFPEEALDAASFVGWKFKKDLFETHAKNLGVTQGIFRYVGVNNPDTPTIDEKGKSESDVRNEFLDDPLGRLHEDKTSPGYAGSLSEKRDLRDVLDRGNPHWDYLDAHNLSSLS